MKKAKCPLCNKYPNYETEPRGGDGKRYYCYCIGAEESLDLIAKTEKDALKKWNDRVRKIKETI